MDNKVLFQNDDGTYTELKSMNIQSIHTEHKDPMDCGKSIEYIGVNQGNEMELLYECWGCKRKYKLIFPKGTNLPPEEKRDIAW